VAILVGLGIGLVLQIVFGELLGLSLPLGPALGWLGPIFGGA
jgi:putative tricarboxylic transport membrane protein